MYRGAKVPHAIDKWLPVLRRAMVTMRRTISPRAIIKWASRPSALSAGKPRCHDQPASGKISGNQIKGASMLRPNINTCSQVAVFSPPSTALTSLTGRSTGTSLLRSAAR